MKRTIRTALAATLLAALTSLPTARAAVDAGGTRFEDKATVAGESLALNGAGIRTRFMFKIYAMGLYLPARAATAEAALSTPGPKRIRLVTLRDLSSEQFVDALIEGLDRNHDAQAMSALRPSIDTFRNTMLAVGKAPTGTTVLLDWIPGSGTRLTVAGARRGPDITDERFYLGLLRIWLGENAVDGDLKRDLVAPPR